MEMLGCVECGWTGKGDERDDFDAGDGLSHLVCPDCGNGDFIVLKCESAKEQWCEFRDSCSCPECEEAKGRGWVELDRGALEQRKKDAETPADDYDWEDDTDDRGWIGYGERMEQQRGY